MRRLLALCLTAGALLAAGPALAKGPGFGFLSPFGGYDNATLQAGFAVYRADCASCHGLNLVHYRDLAGIGLSEKDIAAITAQISQPDGVGANGKPRLVKATPDAVMTWSYADDAAAKAANHGALPPDLSLFESGRANGAAYVQALLLGYRAAPPNLTLLPDHHYNVAFPGGQIAMPPALKPGSVTLADGKQPDQAQMAHDVAEFLAWTADPKLEDRKVSGLGAILFLLVLGGLGAVVFRRRRA